jgi:hypothetical protein
MRSFELIVLYGIEVCTGGCEAEESPLLEAVATERLMKTQQVGKKCLAGALVIYELRRVAVAL